MVVEKAAGMPYMEFVRRRIFEPLQLSSARFKTNGEVVPHRADGYLYADGAYRHGETLRPAVIAANGGVMMNVVDFARWDIAMTSGRLLRPDSLAAMTTPVRLNDGRTVSHGLGWFMDRFNGHRFGAHWGSTVTGHSAVIRRYVDDKVTVIVLGNLEDGGTAVDILSKRIADMYVPGTAVQGLQPRPDPQPDATARIRQILTGVADGIEQPGAPGLAARLPAPVRQRLGAALRASPSLQYLGEETVDASHFTLDPALATNRWYRSKTADGVRYLTVRLSATGVVLGVLIED